MLKEIQYSEKCPCGIPRNISTQCPGETISIQCPGKHESDNIKHTHVCCSLTCPAYNPELHESFYHTPEKWYENPTTRKTEAERIRKF
jgi:hypothetical protein